MIKKNYNKLYLKDIKKINLPQNTITRLFLSRFSPIKKKFKNKKLIDFSCGSGPYLDLFTNLGFKVYATEISSKILSELKKKYKNINFIEGDNENINFPDNFFDYFVAIHSIYYKKNSSESFDRTVNKIKSKIKKNGFLIFTIPAIKQNHLNFLKIKKNTYKITNDKYKLRKNTYFHLFKDQNELIVYFSKFFKIIEIGEIKSTFKNLEENYYLCVLRKK